MGLLPGQTVLAIGLLRNTSAVSKIGLGFASVKALKKISPASDNVQVRLSIS